MGGRARCWRCRSNAAEPKSQLKGKAGLNWGSCRQQIHLQPGRSQPGSASSHTAAPHECPKTGQQHPVPPLLYHSGKGLAGFPRLQEREKRQTIPFVLPRLHQRSKPCRLGWTRRAGRGAAACGQVSAPHCPPGREARMDGAWGNQNGGRGHPPQSQSFHVQSAQHHLRATGTSSGELSSGK